MKMFLPVALLFLACSPLLAQESGETAGGSGDTEISQWGKTVDPDGDCKFSIENGGLQIAVPGSLRPHDMSAELLTTNAPRVLQAIRGDFTLQVKVEGRFSPGDDSTQPGRTPYNGAGLLIMADGKNFITLVRAVIPVDGESAPYANFEIRINGNLERLGTTGDGKLPKEGPVYLRLERRGQKILGATSLDGVKWNELEGKDLPAEWPVESKVGVLAVSTARKEFKPHFSDFRLKQK